jgi:integrase
MKSDETRKKYSTYFKKYLEIQGLSDQFCQNNASLIEREVNKFIIEMKNKKMSYSAIQNYTAAALAFYKINDVILNVTKIGKFMPEQNRVRKDRAYTHEEISKLLEIADERMRVIILLLASSGIRVGAIPSLKMGNLQDNKLTVYENAKEEYFSFITPECRKAVDSYINMRSRYGEKINDESFLVREQFNRRLMTAKQRPLKTITILSKLIDLANICGIRHQGVPIAHGFRKFFTIQLINARISSEIREMLLGHKIGLTSCYYRPTEQEMYEEYEKAIGNLTIDPSNRLQREVEMLTIEKSRLDRIEEKMLKMEQMYQK